MGRRRRFRSRRRNDSESESDDGDDDDKQKEFDPNYYYNSGDTLKNSIFFVIRMLKKFEERSNQIE